MKKITTLLIAAFAVVTFSASAQVKTPQPSPSATVKQAFGLGEITIVYSRPSVKGRVIFGDLVPFDKLWRTGANSSTKISFTEEVMIGGNKVPAGEYALYTIPGKTEWTIMINKNTKLWGTGNPGDYKQEEDVARVKVKPVAVPANVESFTIDISDVGATTAMINLSWEKTKVSFQVETSIDEKIMASIEKTLNPKPEANSYFSAASYYYESDKDLAQALKWVDKAIEQRPDAFWMVHLKAKIQKKMNDTNGAIASANQSKEIAAKANNDDYVALNNKLIAELTAPAKPAKKK
jgi:hypothetical protein